MKLKEILIGSRKSQLAVKQGEEVKSLIMKNHEIYKNNPDHIKIIRISTSGDLILDRNLDEIGGKGLFVKEIEEKLLLGEIDIAVHSMKDVPAFFHKDLAINAILEREDERDAFISKKYNSLSELPAESIVGTSSCRRRAIILNKRPDLKIVNFRGNVNTRIKKLYDEEVDATILSIAGLKRINMENYASSIIQEEEMLPAIAQGAIGVQVRSEDDFMNKIVTKLNNKNTATCVKVERSILKEVNGSCKIPIAANCKIIDGKTLSIKALLCELDGSRIYKFKRKCDISQGEKMGIDIGKEMKKDCGHILIPPMHL